MLIHSRRVLTNTPSQSMAAELQQMFNKDSCLASLSIQGEG